MTRKGSGVRVPHGPPATVLVKAFFGTRSHRRSVPIFGLTAKLTAKLGEEALHRLLPGGDRGQELMAVHLVRHARRDMADDVGDVLDANAGGRQQRHRRVPKLVDAPMTEAGASTETVERAAKVARIHGCAESRREHEVAVNPRGSGEHAV